MRASHAQCVAIVVGFAAVAALGSPAAADTTGGTLAPAKDGDPAPAAPPAASTSSARPIDDNAPSATFHKGQVGVSLQAGLGLRGIATYDAKYYCGKPDSNAQYGNSSVCTGRAPFALDLGLSYGVAQHIELLLELRLGLERDFGSTPTTSDGPRPLRLSPGARFFFSEAKRSKLFVAGQMVFDFTGYKDGSGTSRGNDFGVRGAEGLWVDLHRAYGVYVYIGETAEFARWLAAEFEAGVGFQGRYP